MRFLLTGRNGQLGWELRRTLSTLGTVVAYDRMSLDLRSAKAIREAIDRVRPDVIVNAAAYTAVDRAEAEQSEAMAINADAVAVMADEARRRESLLIHFSTDYVFDGTKAAAYVESDATAPLNFYAVSKLAGENVIRASGCAHLIFRTSWLYSGRGHNFLRTILRLAREREVVRVVNDQHGSPTWAGLAAEAVAQTIATYSHELKVVVGVAERCGTYHLTCGGATTWFEFARTMVETARTKRSDLRWAEVQPIATAEYPTPARRPQNSVLSNAKVENTFGLRLLDWRTALSLAMKDVVL